MQIPGSVKKITRRLLHPAWKRVSARIDQRMLPIAASVADLSRRLNVAELETNHVPVLDRQLHALDARLSHKQLGELTQESLDRLKSSGPRAAPAIAIIAPMPPAKTGIAWCTLFSFLAADYGVDIYAAYESIDEYLNAIHDARLHSSNVRIFSIEALSAGRTACKYSAQLFVLGNSAHNFAVGCALNNLAEFPVDLPTFVHIHDPGLLHLLNLVCRKFDISFEQLLRNAYGTKIPDDPKFNFDDYSALTKRHVYGVKALLRDLRIDGIFVNSTAAADIVCEDFPDFDLRRIHRLFHPVFPPPPASSARAGAGRTLIGTFGVISAGSKGTDVVVEAFRLLRAKRPDVDLLIAGWEAHYFAQVMKLTNDDGIIIEDGPSFLRFDALMRSCDVAVQLRKIHLGESSGVVSQLLALNKPTIVSAVGAFREFGDAVAYAPPDVTPAQLADLISHELDNKEGRVRAIGGYVSNHSPELLCGRLMASIDGALDAAKTRRFEPELFAPAIDGKCSKYKDVRDRYIARVVPGKSFIDVGGLYEIVKERVSRAKEEGATRLALADIEPVTCPWWEDMRKHLEGKGISDCQFISGDIQKIEVEQFDIVYSSGVLYHTTSPLGYLAALKGIAKEFVILGTTVLPTYISGSQDLRFNPATVLYVPATQVRHRQDIARYFAQPCGTDFFANGSDPLNNWYGSWWMPTVQSLVAMCKSVGFDVVDCQPIDVDDHRSCALLLRIRN